VHGHQGDCWNDRRWLWNKLFHRKLWRYIQFFGIRNPARPAKYFKRVKNIEENLKQWAKANEQILIAGHTHSCAFPSLADPPYFNIGSCVSPHCITGIEIENGQISLIEWSVKVRGKRGILYAGKDPISKSYPI
jgi:UDP-2,3-diacylglucosamine pyrophosphatase LpxH